MTKAAARAGLAGLLKSALRSGRAAQRAKARKALPRPTVRVARDCITGKLVMVKR